MDNQAHRPSAFVPAGTPGAPWQFTFFQKITPFLPITYSNPISESTPSPCYI